MDPTTGTDLEAQRDEIEADVHRARNLCGAALILADSGEDVADELRTLLEVAHEALGRVADRF